MPKALEGGPSGKGTSFTQYRSSDYSIIDHPDESSGSSHSPKFTPHLAYRPLSPQLPPITLRHKYVAFRDLEADQHLSELSEPIPSLPLTHSQRITPKSSRIMTSKIRPFRGLRNNKENPEKFLQSIEWLYQVDYKHDEPEDPDEGHAFKEGTLGILFASHLAGKAEDWYDDLELEDTEWNTLVVQFRDYYRIVPRNPKGRQFNLAMKLADLKQQIDEHITSYIERAEAIATKFPGEEFSIGMATVRGMSEPAHQHWIEKECLKKEDFEFGTVKKLVKVSYTRVGQIDPFNRELTAAKSFSGSSYQSVQTQNEMLQQILINQSSIFPAILQTMKAMNSANPSSSTLLNNNYPSKPRTYPRRDLSHIKCFTCGEMGHYASLNDREQAPPVTIRVDPLEAIPANMVQVLEDYY